MDRGHIHRIGREQRKHVVTLLGALALPRTTLRERPGGRTRHALTRLDHALGIDAPHGSAKIFSAVCHAVEVRPVFSSGPPPSSSAGFST
ncbi:MAG: hypothetical protein ACR2MW_00170 [Chthoniobacterales bacterium]